jgi:putative lipoic acid-binding regulatory protein
MAAQLPPKYENLKLLLEEQHDFPGPYTFKVVGPNTPAWQESVTRAAASLLGEVMRSRVSANGRYVSIALNIIAEDSLQVLEMYEALSQLDNVKMLI